MFIFNRARAEKKLQIEQQALALAMPEALTLVEISFFFD